MEQKKIRSAVEAILFASGAPVETEKIAQALFISDGMAQKITKGADKGKYRKLM